MRSYNRFNPQPATRRFAALALIAGLGTTVVLTGCAGSMAFTSASGAGSTSSTNSGSGGASAKLSGRVYGGQQPISGAAIQLYAVGTTGLQSASTALIASPPTTDAGGGFSITGDYSCTNATDVYLVSSGGDSGSGGVNSGITLVAALGPCATLLANAATTYIQVNEVTTVAAAYALAPFASDLTHIGAAGSFPSGLTLAFANAALLANTSTGSSGGANLAAGVTVPTAELNTLGNILASCVNTGSPSSSTCGTLFSATSASDTFGAALAIARNPGANAITNLYALVDAQAPFQPSLVTSSAPNDFAVAVTMSGAPGSLATPYGLAIDAGGNAWVTNESGNTVVAFSPTGSSVTATAPGLIGPQAVAVDKNSNVWVANTAGNSVVELTAGSGFVPGTTAVKVAGNFTDGGITGPTALAVDPSNHVWIANFNGNSVTALTSSGTPLGNSPFTGSNNNITVPTGIAIGSAGKVYVTSGSNEVSSGAIVNDAVITLSSTGAFVNTLSQGSLQGPVAIAVDPATNNTFLSGFTTGTSVQGALNEYPGGSVTSSGPVTGVSSPAGIAFDGTSLWVANSQPNGGLAKLPGGASMPASPSTGYGSLNTPVGVAVDASGSVWTTNSGDNTVSKFIGLAAPVTTPLVAGITN